MNSKPRNHPNPLTITHTTTCALWTVNPQFLATPYPSISETRMRVLEALASMWPKIIVEFGHYLC
jgi:hypothetical protein